MRLQSKLRIGYCDAEGRVSDRVIWPIALAYFDTVRLLVGWCETRQAFRHFRTDRIHSAEFLAAPFPTHVEVLRKAWRRQEQSRGDKLDLAPP